MPVFRVDFEKRAYIYLQAETREAAQVAADGVCEDGDIDSEWMVPENWEATVGRETTHRPDQGVNEFGEICHIDDVYKETEDE